MKLLIWNIRQGGGRRRDRIADAITAHNPGIVALIEFVPSTAEPLLQPLREAGFEHQICTKHNGFDYAICVLAKTPITTRQSGIPTLDDSGLWLEVAVPAHGFSFGVVHVPTKSSHMKRFLDAVVQVGALRNDEPFLIVGDFNTGLAPADGLMDNAGVERFPALLKTGFTDAWRHIHGDLVETTYTFPRTGKQYRIDHALASPGLLSRMLCCRYSHAERLEGASDHSVLLVEIDD